MNIIPDLVGRMTKSIEASNLLLILQTYEIEEKIKQKWKKQLREKWRFKEGRGRN